MTEQSDNTTIDGAFFADNALTAIATFVAPIIALSTAVGVVSAPRSDIFKALARLRHPSRLSFHPRDLAVESAKEDGQSIEELLAEIKAKGEASGLEHSTDRDRKAARRRP